MVERLHGRDARERIRGAQAGGILALNVNDGMLTDSTEALGAGFAFVRRMEYALSRMIGSNIRATDRSPSRS